MDVLTSNELIRELALRHELGPAGFEVFAADQKRNLRSFLARNPALPDQMWAKMWLEMPEEGVWRRATLREGLVSRPLTQPQLELFRATLRHPGEVHVRQVDAFLRNNTPDEETWELIASSRGWNHPVGVLLETLVLSPLVPEHVATQFASHMATPLRVSWAIDRRHLDEIDRLAGVVCAKRLRRCGVGLYDAFSLLALYAPEVAGRVAGLVVEGSAAATSMEGVKVWVLSALRVWDTNPHVYEWLLSQLASPGWAKMPVGAQGHPLPLYDPTLPDDLAAAIAAHLDVEDVFAVPGAGPGAGTGTSRRAEVAFADPDAAFAKLYRTRPCPSVTLHKLAGAAAEVGARNAPLWATHPDTVEKLEVYSTLDAGGELGLPTGMYGPYAGAGSWQYNPDACSFAMYGPTSASREALRVIEVCGDDPRRWELFLELLGSSSSEPANCEAVCAAVTLAFQ